MTAIINSSRGAVRPVAVNFWWETNGREETFNYDGEIYHRKTTDVALPVEFFATKADKPHVEAPPGVSILEYIWSFGDGAKGFGPSVVHEYKVSNQDLLVDLIVVDSLHRRWSTSQPIFLVYEAIGRVVGYKIRVPTISSGKQVLTIATEPATKPRHKPIKYDSKTEDEILSSTGVIITHTGAGTLTTTVTAEDSSKTVDSTIEKGKGHRKHALEKEKEKVLTEDVATRILTTARTGTETSVATEAVVRSYNAPRKPTEEAKASDAITTETIIFHRPFTPVLTPTVELKQKKL